MTAKKALSLFKILDLAANAPISTEYIGILFTACLRCACGKCRLWKVGRLSGRVHKILAHDLHACANGEETFQGDGIGKSMQRISAEDFSTVNYVFCNVAKFCVLGRARAEMRRPG